MVGFDSDPTADSEAYSKLDRSIRDEQESQVKIVPFWQIDLNKFVLFHCIKLLTVAQA